MTALTWVRVHVEAFFARCQLRQGICKNVLGSFKVSSLFLEILPQETQTQRHATSARGGGLESGNIFAFVL